MIVFASITGQVQRFATKLGLDAQAFDLLDSQFDHDFLLIVPSYDQEMMQDIHDFMAGHHTHCLGIIASGNRNFGPEFGKTAKWLCQDFELPYLYEFEFSGTSEDVKAVIDLHHRLFETPKG